MSAQARLRLLRDQLHADAALFDSPRAYSAGVDDALQLVWDLLDGLQAATPNPEEVERGRGRGHDPARQGESEHRRAGHGR
jgi:hypothetical protein